MLNFNILEERKRVKQQLWWATYLHKDQYRSVLDFSGMFLSREEKLLLNKDYHLEQLYKAESKLDEHLEHLRQKIDDTPNDLDRNDLQNRFNTLNGHKASEEVNG